MAIYQHILYAAVLDSDCDQKAGDRACALTEQMGAKLTLVHAVEHLANYGAAYGVAIEADIENVLQEHAKKAMSELGQKLGVGADDQIVKLGPAKSVILEEADKLGADLIIVGSHGREGIRLLLGSTANAVLHSAKVDVLAVRL